jgi:hypothetical protein
VRSVFERIEEKISPEPNSGCWLWMGSISPNGYAYVYVQAKRGPDLVHRILYEQKNGYIPTGLELDHLCRVRCCVNPDHLEPVTRRENVRRGLGPVARNMQKTHCPRGHELSNRAGKNPNQYRDCHICARMRRQREEVKAKNREYTRLYRLRNKGKDK